MNLRLNKPQIYVPFLSLACLSFISGIILVNYLSINFSIFYIMALFSLCVLFYLNIKRKKCSHIIIFIFFLIGLLRQTSFGAINPDDISYLSRFKLKKIALQGVVVSPVEESQFGRSFIFSARNIKIKNLKSKASGAVLVRFNKKLNINYGDVLIIEGNLNSIKDEGYFNKGLIRRGIRSSLAVGWKDWITKDKTGQFSVRKLAVLVKEKLKRRFENISPPAGDFLIAFILGDRADLDQDIYSAFKQTGTVHVIAISGLHIVIVVFILIVFLKALGLKMKSRFIITVLFLLFYSFMTGLRPSVIRAVVMGIVFLLSFLVKREYHTYNSLALSAMIILFIWPWQIFDIGFQLSYISVLAIVFLSPKILALLPETKNRFWNYLKISIVISLSTWFVTTPLVVYYFGIISIISIIANLFVVPFTPFILGGGFLYLLASFINPILAHWFSLSLEFIINVMIFLTVLFRNIPFAYFYIEKLDLWIILLYYLTLVVLFNLFSRIAQRE